MGERRDCTCPRVRHDHGTRSAYLRDRCRCDDCRRANAAYQRRLWRRHAYVGWGSAPPAWAPAVGTVRRLRALSTLGWTMRDLADRLGVTPTAVGLLRATRQDRIMYETARRVAEIYEPLSARVPPPSRQASYARNLARDRGWRPPLSWDDGEIDDPAAPDLCSTIRICPECGTRAERVRAMIAHARDCHGVDLAARIAPEPRDPRAARDAPIDIGRIERAIAGDRVHLAAHERRYAVRLLTERDWPASRIAAALHVTKRTVVRWRAAS